MFLSHISTKKGLSILFLVILTAVSISSLQFYRTHQAYRTSQDVAREYAHKISQLVQDRKTTTIAIITDIDYCQTRNPIPDENLIRFVDFARTTDADMAISLGDNLSHRLGSCSKTATEDLPHLMSIFKHIPAPVHYVLGDHDIASMTDSYRFWLEQTGRPQYYSFNIENVHVIILDTILGGKAMQPRCENDPTCAVIKEAYDKLGEERAPYTRYSPQYNTLTAKRKAIVAQIDAYHDATKQTRSSGKRDKGYVGDEELAWLAHDLTTTKKQKVVVFSDHPLFHYIRSDGKKAYNILGGEAVRTLLEQARAAGKTVVAISGEAHEWHHEKINDVDYYIISQFRNDDGSWASFVWDDADFRVLQYPADTPLK